MEPVEDGPREAKEAEKKKRKESEKSRKEGERTNASFSGMRDVWDVLALMRKERGTKERGNNRQASAGQQHAASLLIAVITTG